MLYRNRKCLLGFVLLYLGYRIYKRYRRTTTTTQLLSPCNREFLALQERASSSSSSSKTNAHKAKKAFLFVINHWRALYVTMPETEFIQTLHQMFSDGLSPRFVLRTLFRESVKKKGDHSLLLFSLVLHSAMWEAYPVLYLTFRALVAHYTPSYVVDIVVKTPYHTYTCLELLWHQLEKSSPSSSTSSSSCAKSKSLHKKVHQCIRDVTKYHREQKEHIKEHIRVYVDEKDKRIMRSVIEFLYGSC